MSKTELSATQVHDITHVAYEAARVIIESHTGDSSMKPWHDADSDVRAAAIAETREILTDQNSPVTDDLTVILKHTIIHTFRRQVLG